MKEKTILCFGDSNTWGASPDGSPRYDRQTRWPCVLQRELGDEYHVIEEGLCGRTTVWDDPIEEYKSGLKQLTPILYSHMPLDLVIIMLGTNDLKNRFSVSALDISWSIGRLVKAVRDSNNPCYGAVPEVMVICPPPVVNLENSPCGDMFIGAEEKSRQLPSVLGAFCKTNSIRMFNAGDVVQSSPIDGIHWAPEEHRKLGVAVASEVRSFL